MSHNSEVPWKTEEAFPEKPVAQDYGYILRRKPVGCSREELIRRCSVQDLPIIQLVWHPDGPRVVPAASVPFLREALRKRTERALETSLWLGVINTVVFGLIGFVSVGEGKSHSSLLLFLAAVGVLPIIVSIRGLRALKRSSVDAIEISEGVNHFGAWVGSQRILFTWILLAAIVIVAALQQISGLEHSIQAAGLVKGAVRRGEWWRLLTAPMMHGGIWHLLFNASALAGLGRLVETLASRYHLALVFAVSALAGSIFSLVLLPHETSVGASGGLLGLIGFLSVLGLRRRPVLPKGFAKSIALNIALVAAMGVIAYAMIDNACHLGGLLAGIAAGVLLINRNDQALPLQLGTGLKIAGTLALAVMLGFASFSCVRMLE